MPVGGPWGWFGPQSVPPTQFTFIAPLIFPYLGYPPAPGDYAPAPEPVEEQPEERGGPDTAAAPVEDDSAKQVETLTGEVEDLRQQQESGQSTEAGPQPALEKWSAPAIFVYLDGQQFEAESYAVLGGTLWIYEDDTIRKIPLAKLDLDETRKRNDERGIDFSVMH